MYAYEGALRTKKNGSAYAPVGTVRKMGALAFMPSSLKKRALLSVSAASPTSLAGVGRSLKWATSLSGSIGIMGMPRKQLGPLWIMPLIILSDYKSSLIRDTNEASKNVACRNGMHPVDEDVKVYKRLRMRYVRFMCSARFFSE